MYVLQRLNIMEGWKTVHYSDLDTVEKARLKMREEYPISILRIVSVEENFIAYTDEDELDQWPRRWFA